VYVQASFFKLDHNSLLIALIQVIASYTRSVSSFSSTIALGMQQCLYFAFMHLILQLVHVYRYNFTLYVEYRDMGTKYS